MSEDEFLKFHRSSNIYYSSGINFLSRIRDYYQDTDAQKQLYNNRKTYGYIYNIDGRSGREDCEQLDVIVKNRRSVTVSDAQIRFSDAPLSDSEISAVVCGGYSEVAQKQISIFGSKVLRGFRTVPSAGGIFSLEIYVWNRVADPNQSFSEREIYHFQNQTSRFGRICTSSAFFERVFFGSGYEKSPPSTVIVVTGIPSRLSIKYGSRAYRFMLIEAGHVMQNMLLYAQCVGLSAVPIGGFFDDVLASELALPDQELPIYCAFLGKPSEELS